MKRQWQYLMSLTSSATNSTPKLSRPYKPLRLVKLLARLEEHHLLPLLEDLGGAPSLKERVIKPLAEEED